MEQENHDPSYILGQLVGTAQCLQQIVETFQDQVKEVIPSSAENSQQGEDIHSTALDLMEQQLSIYEPYLYNLNKGPLLEDLRRIYRLKVKYDFETEALDQNAYELGYEEQIKKHQG